MGRSAKEQISSGIHLAIGAASFLAAMVLVGDGMSRTVWGTVATYHIVWRDPIGLAELMAAALILFSTADIWWQILAGYMFIGSVKGVLIFVTGRDLFAPHDPFSRLESAELTMFAAATVALLFRFTSARPTIADRLALTLFVFCFMWNPATARFSAAYPPSLAAALIVLLISRAVHGFRKNNRQAGGKPFRAAPE
jgi:hypothetical protein